MTRHRTRRLALIGLTLSAMVAALFLISSLFAVGWVMVDPGNVSSFGLWDGAIVYKHVMMQIKGGSSGWRWSMPREGFHLLPRFLWVMASHIVVVPLWIPLVVIGAPSAYLLRLSRRSPDGRCPQCGYKLAGLRPGSPCPECGSRPIHAP